MKELSIFKNYFKKNLSKKSSRKEYHQRESEICNNGNKERNTRIGKSKFPYKHATSI